ncbi:hypothetical protein HDU82_000952, partial [Entophlyctis luteolus]
MPSLFSLITLTVLVGEIAVYLLSLISPSFLPATQRRAMVKQLRGVSKIKNVQFMFAGCVTIVAALFAESAFALVRVWQHADELTYGERSSLQYHLKVMRAEKHLITSGFALMMALVVYMRLREKNNYIKLLEKYENKPEGEDPVKS